MSGARGEAKEAQQLLDPDPQPLLVEIGHTNSWQRVGRADWQTGAPGRIFGGWKSFARACLRCQ